MSQTQGSSVEPTFDAVKHLQQLLRIDTANPPGNELRAVRYIEGMLKESDISADVFEPVPERGNLVARLKGDGSRPPLLLAAHLDVVHAEESSWTHSPFGGEVIDGWIWGRGALDMKNMAIMSTIVLKRLKAEGIALKRDVILACVADEETGCDCGSKYLVEEHPDLVRAEYMLGEIGGYTLHLKGRKYYPVQVAEKGIAWLKLTIRGTPGHGSIPHKDNPVLKLGTALARLASARLPQHNTDALRRFIAQLAPAQPVPAKQVLPLLLNPRLSPLILDKLMPDQGAANGFRAMLSNTISPTVLQGSGNINTIPGEASVYLDGRTLPGFTTEDLIRELRLVLGPEGELSVVREMPPVETSPDNPLFDSIKSVMSERAPDGIVVPFMIPGFTDAKQFSRLGTKCLGFSPLKLPEGISFTKLFHGHNERIPVDGFLWGLETLYEVVKRFVSNQAG